MQTDSHEAQSFRNAWTTLQGRIAVVAGSLVALGAVLFDVPVRIASLRGALTFFAVKFLADLGLKAVEPRQELVEHSEEAVEDPA